MNTKIIMNGSKYKNLKQACESVGLSYANAKMFKKKYGSKFSMKLVKRYTIEIQETGSVHISENPSTVKKIAKDLP
jgi:hypothetical protein